MEAQKQGQDVERQEDTSMVNDERRQNQKGRPLSFKRSITLRANNNNNKSIEDDHSHLHTYIREQASKMSDDPEQAAMDRSILRDALSQVVTHGYGIYAADVYVQCDDTGRLKRVGWCRSDTMPHTEALGKLDESTFEEHVVLPGADVVGSIWANQNRTKAQLRRSFKSRTSTIEDTMPRTNVGLKWRDIKTIFVDPDTSKGERTGLLLEAGLTLATGIKFDTHGHAGMVVYYSTDQVDESSLKSPANEIFLVRSTVSIGALIALSEGRKAIVAYCSEQCDEIDDFVDHHQEADGEKPAHRLSMIDEAKAHRRSTTSFVSQSMWLTVEARFRIWLNKCWNGGGMQIPPSMGWKQTFWTVFGAFIGLLVLSSINEGFLDLTENEYYLVIGPFGALMTLQYGLTSAPASQPRNVVLGQIVAGAVSLCFTYIPESILPVWVRQALGPAFAIGAMVKLGIPHPPAGAHSVIWAAGEHNWRFYSIVVMCSVVSIVPATLVNNMLAKRQYPIYWGYIPKRLHRGLFHKENEMQSIMVEDLSSGAAEANNNEGETKETAEEKSQQDP